MTHFHLVGIGGTGLSAIALVLLERGETVSGSDRILSPLASSLEAAGVQVFLGHRAENVQGADWVIRSSAVPDDNVEVQAAIAQGIPVLKRAGFLGKLMEGQQGIAIAGTHGKTTTTAMIAWMLSALGLDPSYIIGGINLNLGRNAHAGKGPHFVIEADEYDFMFLGLNPEVAVVTNVEHDHPDCFPTVEDFRAAFRQFVERIVPGGVLVVCGDDPGAAALLAPARSRKVRTLSYGISSGMVQDPGQMIATNLVNNARGGYTFDAILSLAPGSKQVQRVELAVPGEHNVRNAMAALSVAAFLDLPLDKAAQALGEFQGTGRRFEVRGEAGGITLVDDYAHHPTEIRATLAAARARYPGRRIWAVWQPHTYSRTRTLFDAFTRSFSDADQVLVTEVYPAREPTPRDGFSSRQLVDAMNKETATARYLPDLETTKDFLYQHLQPGDVVFVLSAGDADQVTAGLFAALQARA